MNNKSIAAPTGPEDIPPPSIVTDLQIVVCVYKLANGDAPAIRTDHINYGNPNHRKWLGRITYWACTNGCSVETMTKDDWDKLPKD